jgi:eukaryotic-like serine/threonine-protein kinase
MRLGVEHLLPSRFTEVQRIGSGTMGVVFEAWDNERRERLALKTLQHATPESIREFKREFRTVAELTHPNLVALYELFCDGGLWFFTMELVRGKPLLKVVDDRTAACPEAEAKPRFFQLACALATLHQAGIVHRDVKPDNVLLEQSERVVLLDFGLTRELPGVNSHLSDWGLVGTPGYMAPELLLGQGFSTASDWYAFGTTLFQALSGVLPFSIAGGRMVRKLTGEAPSLDSLGVAASPTLQDLCRRLLLRDPRARPNPAEVLAVLDDPMPRTRVSEPPRSDRKQVVGREEELAQLLSWVAPRGSSGLRIILIRGASGVGKSTLVRAALSEIDGNATYVVRSRCMPQESVTYNAWDGLLDELRDQMESREPDYACVPADAALVRLFPVLAHPSDPLLEPETVRSNPIETRREAIRGLKVFLSGLSARIPIIAFIDDVHWADADSVALLQELVTDGAHINMVLVLTARDQAISVHLEALLNEPRFRAICDEMNLAPLGELDSEHLLDELGVSDRDVQRRVLHEARGNPFLLTELSRTHESLAEAAFNLNVVLEQRLKGLSMEARALFQVVGLVGHQVPLDVAMHAASLTDHGLEHLHKLRFAGLVRLGESSRKCVEAYHDRWRDALVELLSSTQRQAIYRALAKAFIECGNPQDVEVVAHCHQEGGDGIAAASQYLLAAAHSEANLAFERAAQCYERALVLGDYTENQRIDLLAKCGAMADAVGRGEQAGRAFLHAANLAKGAERIELRGRAARALLSSGRAEEGEAVLTDVLKAVGCSVPKTMISTILQLLFERWRLRRRGLAWRPQALSETQRLRLGALEVAASSFVQREPVTGWLYACRALRGALDGSDERLLLRSLSNELACAATEIHNKVWLGGLIDLGRRLSTSVACPIGVAWFEHAVGDVHFLAGDWVAAEQQLRIAVHRLCNLRGAGHWELGVARRRHVAVLQVCGDMLAPEVDIRNWLDDAVARDDREGIASALFGLGYCELARGQVNNVFNSVHRIRSLVNQAHESAVGADWLEAFALCYGDATTEDLENSLARLRRVHGMMHGRLIIYRVWSRSYEARVLQALARQTKGRKRASYLKELARMSKRQARENWHHATACSLTLDAALAKLEGKPEQSVNLLDQSAALYERYGARLFAASARHASAVITQNQDGIAAAEETLRALNVNEPENLSRAHLPAFYS